MKKFYLLALAAVFMLSQTFTSCDELPEDEDLTEEEQSNNKVGDAYLPIGYDQKTLAAWYMLTAKEENKTRVEAVFLFEDSTFVVTKVKYYSDGRDPEYAINATGRYKIIEGDLTTGKASAVTSDGETLEVEIKDGKLTTSQGEEVFIKMSNNLVPKVIDINGSNNNNNINEITNKLVAKYGNKTVAAFYVHVDQNEMEFRTEAIFLFDDDSMAVAELKVFSEKANQQPEFYIHTDGTYVIKQGDYTNGVITLIPEGSTRGFDVTIRKGVLTYNNQEYYKDGNNSSDNGGNDKPDGGNDKPDGGNDKPQGGDDNPQGGVDAGMAYLPIAYANVPVEAWYSSTTSVEQVSKTVAVFFFTDKRMVMTDIEVYSNGNSPYCTILKEGTYELQKQSDFENGGTVKIINNGRSTEASIAKGQLTLSNEVFTKQDNSKLPNAYDPNGGGNDKPQGGNDGGNDKPQGGDDGGNDKPQGGDDGGNDKPQGGDEGGADGKPQGGDDGGNGSPESGGDDSGTVQYNGDVVAYLPADYAEGKTIAAWYMLTDEESQSIRIEAVFLFTDNTLVVTKNKVYSTADGRNPEKEIVESGTYQLSERSSYENGTADVILSNGRAMTVAINNGVLSAMNEEFTKQDKASAPSPTK